MGTQKKRVAVIGAGPAGIIAIDALAQERVFDQIRVFERREGPGGCWIGEGSQPPLLSDFAALAARTADPPLAIPETLPARVPKAPTTTTTSSSSGSLQQQQQQQVRYSESSVYPYLETNVDDLAMSFSQEPIPAVRSEWSVGVHGPDTPFRHWTVILEYLQSQVERRGYTDLVSYSTTVERAEKVGDEWKVTLRRDEGADDYWWVEWFDGLVVATGHYSVPYIPATPGLEEFAKAYPGSVLHSKHFRGRDNYRGKRVVVVGASVSAADIAVDLTQTALSPVHAVVTGRNFNGYFGDEAFQHPSIDRRPTISHIDVAGRVVHFADGTSVRGVDHLIFGTGFSWTLPFLAGAGVPTRNNRVPDLYQHVVYRPDPSLVFVGAVNAGLTFKIFEWQAVLAASVLAGRARLPDLEEQLRWEQERIAARGDGPKFALVYPDFEEYFNGLREMAGADGEEGSGTPGRKLPPFDQAWFDRFMQGHELRKDMWRRINASARAGTVVVQEAEKKTTAVSSVKDVVVPVQA
ncbi:hypothetical protein BX600DRAFT_480072 [Xylariales sp. PMI_506]|nr:hypothetical protein BX600DRAFT_480072 [Xylariales sp. PMI_506]